VSTRDEIIAGLRELADWLDANPEVPVADVRMRHSTTHRADDEASMAELHQVAALIGVEAVATYKDTHFAAQKVFRGWVTYEVGAIRHQAMADLDELMRLGREAVERRRTAGGGSDA
jgi:hypothetical protein